MTSYSGIEKQERLLEIMQEAKGNSLDIYYVIYQEFLLNDEDPAALLRLIFDFPGRIGEDDSASEKVSPQVESETIRQYQGFLINSVELLMKPNDPVDLFYKNLWKTVFCSPTAPRELDQCAVILKFLNESIPTLPYFQAIDLISMENDEFIKRREDLKSRIQEAVHMFNRHFPQRTEEISQICRLGQSLSTEDACVYWATIIIIVQNSAFNAGYAKGRTKEADTESV